MSGEFWTAWFSTPVFRRAVIIALIVGTALLAINQGDIIMAGIWPPFWKIALTYLVPYLVSSWSAALAASGRE